MDCSSIGRRFKSVSRDFHTDSVEMRYFFGVACVFRGWEEDASFFCHAEETLFLLFGRRSHQLFSDWIRKMINRSQ
jgi:hypothetical protein